MQVLGIAGYSGAGKTTLIEAIIPRLNALGLTVSVIKHAHHRFDIDVPGKDSYRHRQAGAVEVLVTSAHRWVLMHELRDEPEPDLASQLARISPCDLVLVEGFKTAPIPKLEVCRSGHGKPLLHPQDPHIVAIVSDVPVPCSLPGLPLDDPEVVVRFIVTHLGLSPRSADVSAGSRP